MRISTRTATENQRCEEALSRTSIKKHRDRGHEIDLWVDDEEAASCETSKRGDRGIMEPTLLHDEQGDVRISAIAAYGDTIHGFVERKNYRGVFFPGFKAVETEDIVARPGGLKHIDHMVGNVVWNQMDTWVNFYPDVMGFRLYQHFDDNDISTEYSALMSKAMSNRNGRVKFPINEPAVGKPKSQTEKYLEFYNGPEWQLFAMQH